jgi:hypothetical protein
MIRKLEETASNKSFPMQNRKTEWSPLLHLSHFSTTITLLLAMVLLTLPNSPDTGESAFFHHTNVAMLCTAHPERQCKFQRNSEEFGFHMKYILLMLPVLGLKTDYASNVMMSFPFCSSFFQFPTPCFSVLTVQLSLMQIASDLSDLASTIHAEDCRSRDTVCQVMTQPKKI